MNDETVELEAPRPVAEPPIVFGERLTCSVAEAAKAVGLSRSKIYELISEGEVQTAKVGRRRLVSIPSLHRLTHIPVPVGRSARIPS